ncbi:hypothetical protein PENSUB_12338 [Penicillium subrubescens]|uniref:Uncharacterized protein n=1 Tax=Penicillium subrubescens TaxID=1316194 RepID=A0A1Q5SZL9_9EURO|nr:hypothetical protein PENSUB_12338 [Penicillium subrubescens]
MISDGLSIELGSSGTRYTLSNSTGRFLLSRRFVYGPPNGVPADGAIPRPLSARRRSNSAQIIENKAIAPSGAPTPAPIAVSWHVLQVAVEFDEDGGTDEGEDEVETEAVADGEVVVAIASSNVELANSARPGIGQPEGTSKPEVGLSGQTILSPSMIGVPQQYIAVLL